MDPSGGAAVLMGQASDPVAAPVVIAISHLTKHFGAVKAIEDLSFTVARSEVCGFLGPNGAGKTTTLRCLLGLVRPTSGTLTIEGRPYAELDHPSRTVGAVLDAGSFHPGRTARNHLRVLCAAAGIPDARADDVLALTGLEAAADRRVGGYSTGMRQRLGLAGALLGEPDVLVLDEPATGLDPAGINWLRAMLRSLAHDFGKTVLLSSHLLAEMEQTADRVVIISHGRMVHEGTLREVVGRAATSVRARTPQPDALAAALSATGLTPERSDGALVVPSATCEQVGHIAFAGGIELSELTLLRGDLEDVFLALTSTSEEDQR